MRKPISFEVLDLHWDCGLVSKLSSTTKGVGTE